jgi:hypothetical protein
LPDLAFDRETRSSIKAESRDQAMIAWLDDVLNYNVDCIPVGDAAQLTDTLITHGKSYS